MCHRPPASPCRPRSIRRSRTPTKTWTISPARCTRIAAIRTRVTAVPTIAELEKAVATLEGTEDAVAYASGMGALHGAFAQANITPDRPVVAARNVYGATYTLLNKMYCQ